MDGSALRGTPHHIVHVEEGSYLIVLISGVYRHGIVFLSFWGRSRNIYNRTELAEEMLPSLLRFKELFFSCLPLILAL